MLGHTGIIKTGILSIGVAAGILSLAGRRETPAKPDGPVRPNILFIMTDQQSYNMMSCAGNQYLSTPNMDQLAGRGYRFEKTYSVCPVCSPTRFALMTGHYPSEVGIKENFRSVRPERFDGFDTVVQKSYSFDLAKVEEIKKQAWGNLFREAGYETFYAGKTHLWGEFAGYGFTSYERDPFDGPALFAEQFFSEIEKYVQGKPFLMFLSFMEPHGICYQNLETRDIPGSQAKYIRHYRELRDRMSPQEYSKQVPPRKTSRPVGDEHPDMFSFVSHLRHWSRDDWDMYNWIYHRLTETADQQVGRVLNALRGSGLEENTIVIFTSDHGDMQGAHGLVWKNVLLEGAQRVAFIFAGPGIKRGYVDISTLTCNGLDLLPTVCDLAGITVPEGLPGISLAPYLTGKGREPERKHIITESFNAFQITDGRYKYSIYELPGHPELLTDLATDPEETINYADDPGYEKIRDYLKRELMTDLSKRNLTPLPEDRQIEYIWPTRTVKR